MTAAPPLRLFLIAGEPSGDALGAALIAGLRRETTRPLELSGVGGPLMAAEGFESLFPQEELAVMGLAEVLPRLPRVLARLRQTARAALAARPEAAVSIDSPAFGLRVADRVRRADPSIRLIHYVAPSVWAWRPGRAAKLARRVDRLLALLPFEPPLFETHGLTCDFVGHPAAARPSASAAEAAALRARLDVPADAPLLAALPGSRRGELARHLAPMREIVARLAERRPGLRVVMPTLEHLAAALRAETARWAAPVAVLDAAGSGEGAATKAAAFRAADAALAVSGTVTLEVAAAGAPMAVIYRAHPLTAALARRLLRVDTVTLVNLVAGEKAVPEFLQESLRPEPVAAALDALMRDGPERARQRAAAAAAVAALGGSGPAPGTRAARAVLDELAQAASEGGLRGRAASRVEARLSAGSGASR